MIYYLKNLYSTSITKKELTNVKMQEQLLFMTKSEIRKSSKETQQRHDRHSCHHFLWNLFFIPVITISYPVISLSFLVMSFLAPSCSSIVRERKKLDVFGGQLLSEDDHSYWAPPYLIITKETFSL